MNKEIKEIAKDYVKLKEQKAEIDAELKRLEKEYLIPNAETVFLVDLEKKVTYIEAKDKTEIDSEKLFAQLWDEQRLDDILTGFSVTQKALLTFSDGEELVEKYKFVKGKTKESFKVTKMNKSELKEHILND